MACRLLSTDLRWARGEKLAATCQTKCQSLSSNCYGGGGTLRGTLELLAGHASALVPYTCSILARAATISSVCAAARRSERSQAALFLGTANLILVSPESIQANKSAPSVP